MKLEQKEWYVSQPKNSGKGIQLRLIKMKYVSGAGFGHSAESHTGGSEARVMGSCFHRGQNIM